MNKRSASDEAQMHPHIALWKKAAVSGMQVEFTPAPRNSALELLHPLMANEVNNYSNH